MNKEDEILDFVQRCVSLKQEFDKAKLIEPSGRVWTSVMAYMIREICDSQEKPKEALDQVIKCIRQKR